MTPLFQALIEAYKITLSFSDKVVGMFDDEKFAKAVVEIYGREPSYPELDVQIELIKNATDIPTKDKLILLRAVSVQRDSIREREAERMERCAEIINRGMDRRAEVAQKLVLGLLSGGLYLLPDAYSALENTIRKHKEQYDDDLDFTRDR